MDGIMCSPRTLSPSLVESSDEDLSVLPRHTKVIVTGNNRTKSVLVGLQGVVKKAVGLGGWHWLVLKNGIEVKLQRNALSVLEAPTGNEEDEEDADCNNSCSNSDISSEKDAINSIKEFRKPTKRRARFLKPWPLPQIAKSNSRSNRYIEGDCRLNVFEPSMRVNLSKLGTATLWRYWKHFNLSSLNPIPSSKEQLVHGVQHHFLSQHLDEKQVILGFLGSSTRRRRKNKFSDRRRCL